MLTFGKEFLRLFETSLSTDPKCRKAWLQQTHSLYSSTFTISTFAANRTEFFFKFYRYKYPSVSPYVLPYVRPSGLGETKFSSSLFKIEIYFFVCRFSLYMSIYFINILSFGLSVRLQISVM